MMENVFIFIIKYFFVLKIFHFCRDFWSCRKNRISKFMVSGDIQLLRSHLEGEGSLSKSERMKQGEGYVNANIHIQPFLTEHLVHILTIILLVQACNLQHYRK